MLNRYYITHDVECFADTQIQITFRRLWRTRKSRKEDDTRVIYGIRLPTTYICEYN